MNTNLKVLLLIVVLSLCSILINSVAKAQVFKDEVTKELQFEKANAANVIYVANISGDVIAEGYNGDKIVLVAERVIRAKTPQRLEKAKKELGIGVIDRYDTLIVYVKGACGRFGKNSWGHKKKRKKEWSYNWNNCHENYDFVYDLRLKIPQDMHVALSTINNGDVKVKNINGVLDIHNVNGSIELANVSNKTYAHTINGDVHLDYVSAPTERSYFYSLNGDIEAYFPSGLSADMTFKSYNGDFYTNISKLKHQPLVMKNKEKSKDKSGFVLEGKSVISAGKGGVELDFETFNGDVYVREKNK